MNQQLERKQYQTPEPKENPSNGPLVISTTTLWNLRSGKGSLFPYREVGPRYIHPLEKRLLEVNASPRSSTLSDIAEIALKEWATGPRLSKTLPWVYQQEAVELTDQALQAKAQGQETPLSYQLYQSFFEGSDFDARISVKPEDIHNWTQELVKSTMRSYKIKKDYDGKPEKGEGEDTEIWTIPLDEEPIYISPRISLPYRPDRLYRAIYTDVAIRITYRKFADSGIPSCEWQLLADEKMIGLPEAESKYLPLVTIGLSPKADMLTIEQREKDTRMGNKVNSYDRIDTALLTEDVPESVRSDILNYHSEKFRISPHGLVWPASFPSRLVKGEDGVTRCISENNFVHTFIVLTAEQMATLKKPVAFGPDFGASYVTPESTLIEAFRVIRKGLLYNGIQKSQQTERARTLIAGERLRSQLHFSESSRPFIWEKAVMKEAATSCWVAPKEFIHLGGKDNFNLGQYFPNWHYLQEIESRLPSYNEMQQQLVAMTKTGKPDLSNVPGFFATVKEKGLPGILERMGKIRKLRDKANRTLSGGWTLITQEVRTLNNQKKAQKSSDYNPMIHTMNDLELIFWLLKVE